jgi:hypothetical protein
MNYTELVTAVTDYTENTVPTVDMNTFIEQAEQRIYNTIQFPSLRANKTGLVTTGNKYLSAPDDFLSVYSLAVIENYGTANENYTYLLNKDVNFIREAYPSPAGTGLPKYYALFGPTTTSGSPPVPTNELSFILGPSPDAAYYVELHYYYYPPTIIQGAITLVSLTTPGAGLTDGTYYNVALTGGSGNSAAATITVSGGYVTAVDITQGGAYYVAGDALSVSLADIGGAGTTFTGAVYSVSNATGQTWLGDNYDSVLLYGTLVEAYTYMKGEQDLVALYMGRYKEALAEAKRLGDGLERQDSYRSGQFRQVVT